MSNQLKIKYLIGAFFLSLFLNSCSSSIINSSNKLYDLKISDFFSNHKTTTLIDKNIIELSLESIKKKYGNLEYENLLVFEVITSGEYIEAKVIYKLYSKNGNFDIVYYNLGKSYKFKNIENDYPILIDDINTILIQASGLKEGQISNSSSSTTIYDIKKLNTEITYFDIDLFDIRAPLIAKYIEKNKSYSYFH